MILKRIVKVSNIFYLNYLVDNMKLINILEAAMVVDSPQPAVMEQQGKCFDS